MSIFSIYRVDKDKNKIDIYIAPKAKMQKRLVSGKVSWTDLFSKVAQKCWQTATSLYIFWWCYEYFNEIEPCLSSVQSIPVKTTVARCNGSALTRAFSVAEFQRTGIIRGERFIVELALTQSQMKQRIGKKEWRFVLAPHEGAVTQSKRGWVAAICCWAPPLPQLLKNGCCFGG